MSRIKDLREKNADVIADFEIYVGKLKMRIKEMEDEIERLLKEKKNDM